MKLSLCGPSRDPSRGRLLVDGLSVALLLVAIFAADTFNTARMTLDALRGAAPVSDRAVVLATPDWLATTWIALAVCGGLLGAYVGCRLIRIDEGLRAEVVAARRSGQPEGAVSRPGRIRPLGAVIRHLWEAAVGWLHSHLPWVTYGAVIVWVLAQGAGAAAVSSAKVPDPLHTALYWLPGVLGIVAVGLAGAVPGDATVAVRVSVVRIQLVFLVALFVMVFRAPFTSDQMTDVLRAWGDGPPSRAVAGIAAALLLGAILRASADRLLIPDTRVASNATGRAVSWLARPARRSWAGSLPAFCGEPPRSRLQRSA